MVKARQRVETAATPKKRVMHRAKGVEKGAAAPDLTPQFWKQEIAALSEQRFQTVDQAVAAVVDSVVKRFQEEGHGGEQMRQFLTFLFDTDPDLKAQVARVLRVRS